LPIAVKDQCREKYNRALETAGSNLHGQLLNCIKELDNPNTESYIQYLDHIDSLAGTNWRKLFIELVNE